MCVKKGKSLDVSPRLCVCVCVFVLWDPFFCLLRSGTWRVAKPVAYSDDAFFPISTSILCPVGRGSRIHRPTAPLQRGKTPPNECTGYDTKQSDGEVPAMLELWGMQSTPSLPSLPGPLWPGVVAPDKGPIYGLNRTNSILILNWIVWVNWIAWKRNDFDN